MRVRYLVLINACVLLALSGCAGVGEKATEKPVGDSAITAAIREKIAADPELTNLKITVVTVQREVVLSGIVPSRELQIRVIKLALGIEGVKSVKDNITVRKK